MIMDEFKKYLEELKNRRFMLAMKDRWDSDDFRLSNQLDEEIEQLEKEIADKGKE